MKQIYKALDFIGDYYNYIIFNIFTFSILILVLNNNDNTTFWEFYDTRGEYDIGNGIWNNILTGLIGSTVFYWLVQYFPDRRKKKRVLQSIDKDLHIIKGQIIYMIEMYKNIYEINNYEELVNINKFIFNNKSDIKNELTRLVATGDAIENHLSIINNTQPINILDHYDSKLVNLYYDTSFCVSKRLYKGYLLSVNDSSKEHNYYLEKIIAKNLGKDLHSLYKYSEDLEYITSSSSKQSSSHVPKKV